MVIYKVVSLSICLTKSLFLLLTFYEILVDGVVVCDRYFYSTIMMITAMGKVGLVASSSSLTDKNNTTRQLCRRHLFSSSSMSWWPDLLMLLSTIAMISLMFNQAGVTGIIS